MSFKAILHLGDLKVNVLHAEYTFRQPVNKEHFPVQLPQSGFIVVYVESTSDTTLFDWMLSPAQKKSGRIIFYKRDNQSKLKELIFSDAYCVSFHEKYSSKGSSPLSIEIKISAGAIKLGQSEYLNPWYENKGVEGEDRSSTTKTSPNAPEEHQEREGEEEETNTQNKTLISNNSQETSKVSEIENSVFDTQIMDEDYIGEETGEVWGTEVKYLNEEQRKKLELNIIDGLVYDAEGKLYDTSDAKTAFRGGNGKSIFVMDEKGKIYASKYQAAGLFHHSSFLSGKPVAAAGELVVASGMILEVNNKSGHYKPTPELNSQFIKVLKSKGVQTDKILVNLV